MAITHAKNLHGEPDDDIRHWARVCLLEEELAQHQPVDYETIYDVLAEALRELRLAVDRLDDLQGGRK